MMWICLIALVSLIHSFFKDNLFWFYLIIPVFSLSPPPAPFSFTYNIPINSSEMVWFPMENQPSLAHCFEAGPSQPSLHLGCTSYHSKQSGHQKVNSKVVVHNILVPQSVVPQTAPPIRLSPTFRSPTFFLCWFLHCQSRVRELPLAPVNCVSGYPRHSLDPLLIFLFLPFFDSSLGAHPSV